MKTNNISTNSQATSQTPSYISINLRLTTRPFGENGDSNLQVVMNALSNYKFYLLEHAKRESSGIESHGDTSVLLGHLREIEQISDLQHEMQHLMIMTDRDRVKSENDQSKSEESTLPVSDPADKPYTVPSPLQSKYDALHELIEEFLLEEGVQPHLNRLTELWNHWSVNSIGDGDGGPDAIYQVSSKALDKTFSIMRLMCFLTSIGETWSGIQRLSDKSRK